jgi:ATP-dependent Clp protease ATP-binding subunit ClpA
MMSRRFQETFARMTEIAAQYGNGRVLPEHLLLSLTKDEDAVDMMNAAGIDIDTMENMVDQHLKARSDYKNFKGPAEGLTASEELGAVMRDLQVRVQTRQVQEVNGMEMLIIMLRHRNQATLSLEAAGLNLQKATEIKTRGVETYAAERRRQNPGTPGQPSQPSKPAPVIIEGGPALREFCVHLNKRANEGKIDKLTGRDKEVTRTVQILSRRSKNNPLYVGEPGVGKTAMAEGLAKRIVEGDVPENLKNAQIFSLDMGALLAGTRYRGDFEERLKNVVKEIQKVPNAVLFIDEIHTVVGAGATSGGSMDASNLLKPALTSGLRVIGSTTYDEFRKHFEKDRALLRRFQKIDINEPSIDETKEILRNLAPSLEKFHNVTYTAAAIDKAVELSSRYIHDRKLPDKAIDVLDEAGAAQASKPENQRLKRIGVAQIEEVVASIARIPAKTMSQDDAEVLKSLNDSLKSKVYDQDPAVDALTTAIKVSRAGLRHPEKPIGSYLFSGPTGVGKTEVAKQLAKSLGVELIRYDMSEYMEKHAVARLIGAPPGYVGFDQAGLLTNDIDKQPYCVLLLDEIEKAHPDIYNILLQVMDHGKLTDNNGKKVDFRNVILIMTTNAGAAEMQKPSLGFGGKPRVGDDQEAIKRMFTPEFRNRLDAVVPFQHLKQETMVRVVDKFVDEIRVLLRERSQGPVTLTLTDGAREWLAKQGYDPMMGARPLGRVIDQNVRVPMSDELLFGNLKKGGEAIFDVRSDKQGLTATYNAATKKAKPGVPANDDTPQAPAARFNPPSPF